MITYRNATLSELNQILAWAADEGWNPGLDDALAFFDADPQGFFVAVDETKNLLAAISVVNHSDGFAFLGLYIVRPAYRDKGIGLALWQHAIEHAGVRTIGLDGVEAQQQNYAKSGFVHAGSTTRFSGLISGKIDPIIRGVTSGDIPKLIAMEAVASGTQKQTYLSAWFQDSAHRTTVVSETAEGIDGVCTIRHCQTGSKIGPLVVEHRDVARRLIRHVASFHDGPLTLDVPETSVSLHQLCEEFKLIPGFKTARMYRGDFPKVSHSTFAVTSLELG